MATRVTTRLTGAANSTKTLNETKPVESKLPKRKQSDQILDSSGRVKIDLLENGRERTLAAAGRSDQMTPNV